MSYQQRQEHCKRWALEHQKWIWKSSGLSGGIAVMSQMSVLYEWFYVINRWNSPSNAIQDVYVYTCIFIYILIQISGKWDLELQAVGVGRMLNVPS